MTSNFHKKYTLFSNAVFNFILIFFRKLKTFWEVEMIGGVSMLYIVCVYVVVVSLALVLKGRKS